MKETIDVGDEEHSVIVELSDNKHTDEYFSRHFDLTPQEGEQ